MSTRDDELYQLRMAATNQFLDTVTPPPGIVFGLALKGYLRLVESTENRQRYQIMKEGLEAYDKLSK